MPRHSATVAWQAAPGGFERGRFSRAHRWRFDGGLEVPASASPAVIPAPWSDASGIDPEEAFVAALASCHMMSFLYLANRDGIEVRAYEDEATGELGRREDGRRAMTQVTLRPRVVYGEGAAPDAASERALHEAAHEICYIANSVTTTIVIEPQTTP